MVQCVKQLYTGLASHIRILIQDLTTLFLVQPLATVFGKAAEDSPSSRSPTHWKMRMKLLVPGFGRTKLCLFWE